MGAPKTAPPVWVPAGRRKNAWETIPVVEAQYPRKAPREIASGISFRDNDLAGARCAELIKVCDFYEAKSSGTYTDSALCGRYLHAMAREIRTLSSALREGERKRRQRVNFLERICAEWEEHFAADKAEGQGELRIVPSTPAAVASQIKRLRERVKALEETKAELEASVESERERARQQLEEYQAASRDHAERTRRRVDKEATVAAVGIDALQAAFSAAEAELNRRTHQALEEAARSSALSSALDAERLDVSSLREDTSTLRRELATVQLKLEERESALRSAALEVRNARELRRRAVDDALEAERTARAARMVSVHTQCPASSADSVRFAWSPRCRSKPGSRLVVAYGVPPNLSQRTLLGAIASRLGVDILQATPRRTSDVDGARVFDLLAATTQDASRLVEAASLPDAPDFVKAPTPVCREPHLGRQRGLTLVGAHMRQPSRSNDYSRIRPFDATGASCTSPRAVPRLATFSS